MDAHLTTEQTTPPQRFYTLPTLTIGMFVIEIVLIGVLITTYCGYLLNFDSTVQLHGVDYALLTHQGGFAARIFQQTGRIPLWNPFIGNGESMLESVQSFVLNPLMITPYLIWGTPHGVNVTIYLHIMIVAFGGWVLGRVTGLRPTGRVLLALLLAGNGSITGPLNRGVFELALSQAYFPWVLAGLIGTLYLKRRVYVGMLAVATTLLIFSGTFWYVLPMALICASVVMLALPTFNPATGRPQIDLRMLARVLVAGVFILGLSAIRILPVDRSLLFHPVAGDLEEWNFAQTMERYFSSAPQGLLLDRYWKAYHYIVSLPLLVAVLALRLALLRRLPNSLPGRWRLPIAAIIVILVFTLWAQGTAPIVKALYDAIPILDDWRNPLRIAAVVTPWLAFVTAVCLDGSITALWTWRARLQGKGWLRYPLASATVILTAWAGLNALDVLNNWHRMVSFESTAIVGLGEPLGLQYLRDLHPYQFLNVQNREWVVHYGYNATLTRYAYGDQQVFTLGLPPTVGPLLDLKPEFAVGTVGFEPIARGRGYLPYEAGPTLPDIGPLAYYHPKTYPYAFWSAEQDLSKPELAKAVNYWHQINQIIVTTPYAGMNAALTVQETAYPGWEVTVNGKSAQIESVSGRIGVRLPASNEPVESATVVFSYRPPKVYWGGFFTLITALLITVYLLGNANHVLWLASMMRRLVPRVVEPLIPVYRAFMKLFMKEI